MTAHLAGDEQPLRHNQNLVVSNDECYRTEELARLSYVYLNSMSIITKVTRLCNTMSNDFMLESESRIQKLGKRLQVYEIKNHRRASSDGQKIRR